MAAVSVAALSSIALQPRQLRVPAADAAAPVADVAPMLELDTTDAVAPTPAATAAPVPTPVNDVLEVPVLPLQPAQPTIHTVEEGDSIRGLADKFGISPETIQAANGISNADLLQIGQDLIILPTDGILYKLKAGESIRMIADKFSVDPTDIVRANILRNPDVVQPGTTLLIPGATPVVPTRRMTAVAQAANSGSDQTAAAIGDGVSLPIPIIDAATATPSTRTYEVQPGDTLAGIADTFGVDVQTILSSNGVDDPDTIHPGSELRILPVKGLEYTVQASETLADVAWKYQVDLGLLLDYNNLDDPDMIHIGDKLVVPGARPRPVPVPAPPPVVEAPAPRTQPAVAAPAVVQVPAAPAPRPAAAAPRPAAPAPAPAPAAPALTASGGGGSIVANAMKFLGYRYVFGGTSPAGFDCSGFVYYVHNHSGAPVGRGMWQQYNGGAHISMSALQPGDTVFFANTYMAGLSHDGIYIGGGQFIHASDERTGVTISSLYTSYWQSHYAGATRLWN